MSSRTSFAAGGLVAAFLMGVLLVASLACEGGSPPVTGSGVTGACSGFLGAYVIASLDGAVSKEVVEQTGSVTEGKATLPATTKTSADLVILAFELENSDAKTNCSKVVLTSPVGTTTTAFNFGDPFLQNSLETVDVTTFYNTNGKGAYSIEVSTDTTKCPGTTTTLSNAWLNVVDNTTSGPCCDCYEDMQCSAGKAENDCCWGHGDWDMWVTLDSGGTIGDTQVDILVQLNPDPWFGLPRPPAASYIFYGTLACASGSFSATDPSLCASISGTLDPAGGSSGTLRVLADPCDAVQTEICSSEWDDFPWELAVCSFGSDPNPPPHPLRCFLCEPLGTPLGSSDDATTSPQLRESPVLQRLRRGR
jgi:hypothetical protein